MAKLGKASDVKVAVIGYGGSFNMGKWHLDLAKEAGMTPIAVADVDPQRLEVAAKDFAGIQTYESVSGMLKKSDANLAVVITPHNTHAKLALQCLAAGRHVICEKPLAITTAECDAMIAKASKGKLLLSTFHNRHWDGCIMRAVKELESGIIGDIVRVEASTGGYEKPGDWWRSSKSISGGILYDWGVHLLEYALQIIKSDMTEVSGFATKGFWGPRTTWKSDANEDEASAVVRFANGALLILRSSSINANPRPFKMEITGTKGTYWFKGEWWELHTYNESGHKAEVKGWCPADEWWRYYRNIADNLTKGSPLVITPQWARRLIHVLELAGKSAAEGKALAAKYA
jgi:scyllo-inositol 2-dehydrogenase (NADP+)